MHLRLPSMTGLLLRLAPLSMITRSCRTSSKLGALCGGKTVTVSEVRRTSSRKSTWPPSRTTPSDLHRTSHRSFVQPSASSRTMARQWLVSRKIRRISHCCIFGDASGHTMVCDPPVDLRRRLINVPTYLIPWRFVRLANGALRTMTWSSLKILLHYRQLLPLLWPDRTALRASGTSAHNGRKFCHRAVRLPELLSLPPSIAPQILMSESPSTVETSSMKSPIYRFQ